MNETNYFRFTLDAINRLHWFDFLYIGFAVLVLFGTLLKITLLPNWANIPSAAVDSLSQTKIDIGPATEKVLKEFL